MQTVAVIGAGQMGSGIAQVVAQAGLKVLLSDVNVELAEKAKAKIAKGLSRLVEKDKIAAGDAEVVRELIDAQSESEVQRSSGVAHDCLSVTGFPASRSVSCAM